VISLSAVLLAGGKGQRMGRDKAMLDWRGRPLWQIQVEKLRALSPERLLLSSRIEPQWSPPDMEVVFDAPPSRGPLSGLAAAMAAQKSDHLLALAIDMPEMTTEHLRRLGRLISEEMGVIPMIGERAEPLAAIYPKRAGEILANALDGSDVSLQSAVRRMVEAKMLRPIPVRDDERIFYRNLNEPSDLAG